jgi:hypothetical protein
MLKVCRTVGVPVGFLGPCAACFMYWYVRKHLEPSRWHGPGSGFSFDLETEKVVDALSPALTE